ncbi:MAG: DUF47 domain-containing protein [Planctomycetota bacterium]|jgi:uncharacterized protein Yka (UPF0111/DUF47 family)
MATKQRIIGVLGEEALLLPLRLNAALAANDRAKYYFTLLQTAAAQATAPRATRATLTRERVAAGIADAALDAVVRRSALDGDACSIPGLRDVHGLLVEDVRRMIEALAPLGGPFEARLERLLATAPDLSGDRIPVAYIDALTCVQHDGADSLHLLVLDLHQALNARQAEIAEEDIGGARAYGIDPSDRPRIEAFMAGLRRTAPLRFDHPGLDTTATRFGGRLVLQNDIGTTDAHVLVVHVDGRAIDVTYTDVHLQRALFFQSLFDSFGVEWQDTRARKVESFSADRYHLCTGTWTAPDDRELDAFLTHLGSRLVFLIDWNRARKRLRPFVGKRTAVKLLRWAAEQDVGHRGFLELGGERLVFEALDYAAKTPLRYGDRLDRILGETETVRYLRFVLSAAAEYLLAGRSRRFIRDAVRTELLKYFHTAGQTALDLFQRHATYTLELAQGVRRGLLEAAHGDALPRTARLARRAVAWERKADAVVGEIRRSLRRSTGTEPFEPIIHQADDAADCLEEAAHLLTLMPESTRRRGVVAPLHALAHWAVASAQEYIKALEAGAHVDRDGAGENVHDFLEGVERVVHIEHETDATEREVTAALLESAADFRELHVLTRLASLLESTADCLSHAALMLRDYLLEKEMSR